MGKYDDHEMETRMSAEIPMLTIEVKGYGNMSVAKGTTVGELAEQLQPQGDYPWMAAIIHNTIRDFQRRLEHDSTLELIDINHPEGNRIYQRTVTFILIKACRDLFPSRRLMVRHSISNGLFCEFVDGECSAEEVDQIKCHMSNICEQDLPLQRFLISRRAGSAIFAAQGQYEKLQVLKTRGRRNVHVYELAGFYEYFYGHMLDRTGRIKEFNLLPYMKGLILQTPMVENRGKIKPYELRPQLAEIFKEEKAWARMMEVPTLEAVNKIIEQGRLPELVRINEALQEKKIAYIADQICGHPERRIVLISGPSSSGKSTFAERLMIQLRVNGKKPVSISLDNYFIDKVLTPRDEEGNYDFENIEALKLDLINEHLQMLMAGEEIDMPIYNFITGTSSGGPAVKLRIAAGEPLVIEGIHALNDKLTSAIPAEQKYKIHISALTQVAVDYSNRIPTTDARLLRRIIRDHRTRGYPAQDTIKMWPNVRRGEEKNIFPYQENADIMFNSALTYELAVIRPIAEPLLNEITASHPEYIEARRLLKLLSYFEAEESSSIPANSILREFIGGSCFHEEVV